MELNELILKNEKELTTNQLKFISVHQNILNAGAMITNSVISLSKNLKVMRDEKLFKEIDCESFEDYAERICGLKKSQAYKYIQVLEKLGEDFVQLTGQIGIEKLTILAKLPEEEKQVIVGSVKVEDITVSELKKEIEKLKELNETQKNQLGDFEIEKQNLLDEKQEQVENFKNQINTLNLTLKELQDKETKVVQSTGKNEEIEKLNKQIITLKEKLKISKEDLENLEKLSKEKEDKYLQDLENSKNQLSYLQKQNEINNCTELVEFKLKFNELQEILFDLKNLIDKVPENKQQNCKNALKKVVEVYA